MTSGPRTISFGLVDGEIIFMDLRSDSYFCLESEDLAALAASVQDRQLLERGDPRLEALGMSDEPVELVRAHIRPPVKSLVDAAPPSPPRVADIVAIALLLRNTRYRLVRQPVEECLSELIHDPRRTRLRNGGDGLSWSERFLRARKLVPLRARDQCLLDSLALLRWLGDLRSGAALVFGVKLNPFAAHCWVQADDLVLNDRLDNVAAFTPLLMIPCSPATQ